MLDPIHAVDLGLSATPAYRAYVDLTSADMPGWLRNSPVWERALAAVRKQPTPSRPRFIHRDYHPDNTLWSRGRLTGVFDWTPASIPAVEVDVSHMRWNLAATTGFRNIYKP